MAQNSLHDLLKKHTKKPENHRDNKDNKDNNGNANSSDNNYYNSDDTQASHLRGDSNSYSGSLYYGYSHNDNSNSNSDSNINGNGNKYNNNTNDTQRTDKILNNHNSGFIDKVPGKYSVNTNSHYTGNISLNHARSLFIELSPEKRFRTVNGKLINNLMELYEELPFMSREEFSAHVNEERNDFALWIGEILHEKGISSRLMNSRTQEGFIYHLAEEIKAIEDKTYNDKKSGGRVQKDIPTNKRPPIRLIRLKQSSSGCGGNLQNAGHQSFASLENEIFKLIRRMDKIENKIDEVSSKVDSLQTGQNRFLDELKTMLKEQNQHVEDEIKELEQLEKELEWRRKHLYLLEKNTSKKEHEIRGKGGNIK